MLLCCSWHCLAPLSTLHYTCCVDRQTSASLGQHSTAYYARAFCAGKIRLSKQTWVSEGTVNIRNGRHVILQAGDYNPRPMSSSQPSLSSEAPLDASSHMMLLPLTNSCMQAGMQCVTETALATKKCREPEMGKRIPC